MSGAGRPLHFLGWVLGGWVALRVGVLAMPMLVPQPDEAEEASFEPERKRPVATNAAQAEPVLPTPLAWARISGVTRIGPPFDRPAFAAPSPAAPGPPSPEQAPIEAPAGLAREPAQPDAARAPLPPLVDVEPPVPPTAKLSSPWSLTGWLLWRRDPGASLAQGPLLGGSQGGIRLDYRLWSRSTRSLGLYGRLTRALERPFAEEAAVGIALRPVEGLPVSLMAERRQKLGAGGRSGFAFLAAGGIGPKAIAPRLEVEGYAQAGIVTAPGSAGFADGKLALDYRLMPKSSPDLAIGFSVSGGAQPGVTRLDIGPELRLRLPVAGGHVRLSAEWRQRIAGAARPASGPALALVTDF